MTSKIVKCPRCKGSGEILIWGWDVRALKDTRDKRVCPVCKGRKAVVKQMREKRDKLFEGYRK